MSETITIRELRTMPGINATVELQKAVWRMHDVEVSSPHTLRAIVHAGGAVIGAEAEGRLVGFCFGMAAWREGELWLWSHMAGVRPEYQGRGVGLKLKLAQREWALGKGFSRMAWTFDPMQSGNANFNFNRLGTTARNYSVNHYGDMQDGINAGMASDRLEAQWQLDSPRVIALAEGRGPGAYGLRKRSLLNWYMWTRRASSGTSTPTAIPKRVMVSRSPWISPRSRQPIWSAPRLGSCACGGR